MKRNARVLKKRRSYTRLRQSRWRRYLIRRKYNIRRRAVKYRVHYDKFISEDEHIHAGCRPWPCLACRRRKAPVSPPAVPCTAKIWLLKKR